MGGTTMFERGNILGAKKGGCGDLRIVLGFKAGYYSMLMTGFYIILCDRHIAENEFVKVGNISLDV